MDQEDKTQDPHDATSQGDTPAPSDSTASNPPAVKAASRRDFLKTLASAGVGIAGALAAGSPTPAQAQHVHPNISGGSPPLAPAPGSQPWHATLPIYSGTYNLATGNAQIVLPVCSWSGRGGGLNFALVYNSQSTRSSALGPKWTYSYRKAILGTNPAIFIDDDGTETSYTLSGTTYTAPVGIYDTLVHNTNGSWTLTKKSGIVYQFRASDGLLTSIVDLNGNTLSLSYNGSYLTTITDAANRTLSLGYNASNQINTITDCANRVWTLAYDTSSRISSISDPLLGGLTYSRTVGYGSSNNTLTSLQNRLQKTWNYAYGGTPGTLLTGTTDPDGKTSSNPYAHVNTVAQPLPGNSGWPSGTAVACTWTDLDGMAVQHGLDSSGRRVAMIDSGGNQANWEYNTSNNRTGYQDQAGNIWLYQFDTAGNEKQVQDPYGKLLTRVFGSYGRISTQTDALSNLTQWFYDANYNLQTLTDANNHSTVYVNNPDGSVQQVTTPTGVVTKYGYDTWGHQNSVSLVLNGTTSFTTAYTYTIDSVLTQRVDANGDTTNYTPDAWGRITNTAYPTTGNPGISLTLDAESNWTQSVDGTGTRTYGYNSWNRCTSMTDPRGNTSATWSAMGFLKNQTDVTNRLIVYTPNTLEELSNVSDDGGATNAVLTYKPTGQVATVTCQNGTKVTYGYDNAQRVNSIQHTVVSSGALLIGYTATYYDNGWLHTVTESSGDVTTYQYDNVGNLLSEVRTGARPYSGTYTYFPDNQRETAVVVTNGVTVHNGTYSYDGAGRLSQCVDTATTPTTTEEYTWNNNGTLSSAPGSGYTKLFFYNEESQLITIQHNTGGTITTAYQYGYAADGGRRWKKDIANNVWTWYPCGAACKAGALVEETSDLTGATWTTSALYLRTGGDCSARLIRRVSSTDSEYHHEDIVGNFSLITGSTAAVLSNNLYDTFGVQQFANGNALTPYRPAAGDIEVDGLTGQPPQLKLAQRDLPLQQLPGFQGGSPSPAPVPAPPPQSPTGTGGCQSGYCLGRMCFLDYGSPNFGNLIKLDTCCETGCSILFPNSADQYRHCYEQCIWCFKSQVNMNRCRKAYKQETGDS